MDTVTLRAGGKSVTMDGDRFDAAARHIIGGAGRRRRDEGEQQEMAMGEVVEAQQVLAAWDQVLSAQVELESAKETVKQAKSEYDEASVVARRLQAQYRAQRRGLDADTGELFGVRD